MYFERFCATLLAAFLVVGMLGCSPSTTSQPEAGTSTPSPDDSASMDDHAGHQHADHDTSTESDASADLPEGLAELAGEDHVLALNQKICPVSGEALGSMGAPEKLNVNGKAVWICCDGCKERLLAEPDKYLAVLAEKGVTPPDFE